LASGGDERAFEALCRRYRPRLLGYCSTILRDPDDAQDAVQETLTNAYRGLRKRALQVGFAAWLFAIARNTALDVRRRRTSGTALSTDADCEPVSDFDLDELIAGRAAARDLLLDISQLPARQQRVLVMHEFNGLAFDLIAARLQVSPSAARQAATDARKSLRVAASGRTRSCEDVRVVLAAADPRGRRQGWVKAHLRDCGGCRAAIGSGVGGGG
jgi:RNA polymerase sigma-70 factor (ECF subfamily)